MVSRSELGAPVALVHGKCEKCVKQRLALVNRRDFPTQSKRKLLIRNPGILWRSSKDTPFWIHRTEEIQTEEHRYYKMGNRREKREILFSHKPETREEGNNVFLFPYLFRLFFYSQTSLSIYKYLHAFRTMKISKLNCWKNCSFREVWNGIKPLCNGSTEAIRRVFTALRDIYRRPYGGLLTFFTADSSIR